MTSLLDDSLALLGPELVARTAGTAGVAPDAAHCALGAAVPLVLAAMATRAHDPALLARLTGMVANAEGGTARAQVAVGATSASPDDVEERSFAELGASLREALFGARAPRVARSLGALVGQPAAGDACLAVGGGVVLAAIARTLAAHGEGFAGLSARLAATRDDALARTAPELVSWLGEAALIDEREAR
jgi:hypothetical protein